MIKVLVAHMNNEPAIHNDFDIEECDGGLVIEGFGELEDHGNGLVLRFKEHEIPIEYRDAEHILSLLLANYDGKMELVKPIRSI